MGGVMRQKSTLLILSFVAIAAITAVIGHLFFAWMFALSRTPNTAILGDRVVLTMLLGLIAGVAVGGGLYAWLKARVFAGETIDELDKVNWPSGSETRVNALVVIVTSVIAALIIGSFDLLFGHLSGLLAKTTWHF
jgi:preprotein translocase SecE subunit